MKVTIECESAFETRRALGGVDAWLVLVNLMEEMRRCVKHSAEPHGHHHDANDDDIVDETTTHWCARLAALCDDYRVDLDDDEEVTS